MFYDAFFSNDVPRKIPTDSLSTQKKTILIVDDDMDIVQLLEYNLCKAGYDVKASASGLEALWEMMGEKRPDCILLDIMMPSPNGFEICAYLKSSPEFSDIPVVIISARGNSNDIKAGLQLGANAYLPKPFGIDLLLKVIHDQTSLS